MLARSYLASPLFIVFFLALLGCGSGDETSQSGGGNGQFDDLIVYTCFDGQDNEICAINPDATGFRQLTSNAFDDAAPSINSSGIIAYQCTTRICLMDANGHDSKAISDDRARDL